MNAGHLAFCASPEWRRMVEETILPIALERLDLGDDVIEIGPGPGFTTDVLRQRTAVLTAVEIDPGLADALTIRLAGTNVEVVRGDATALQMPASRFSGAASFHMLHHIPTVEKQQAALAELSRVLRPGGAIVVADAGYSEALDHFHHDDIYNPIEANTLADHLTEAGFTDVLVRPYDLGWIGTARAA